MLYMREMDESIYSKICAVSFPPYSIYLLLTANSDLLLGCQRSVQCTDEGIIVGVSRPGQESTR